TAERNRLAVPAGGLATTLFHLVPFQCAIRGSCCARIVLPTAQTSCAEGPATPEKLLRGPVEVVLLLGSGAAVHRHAGPALSSASVCLRLVADSASPTAIADVGEKSATPRTRSRPLVPPNGLAGIVHADQDEPSQCAPDRLEPTAQMSDGDDAEADQPPPF